MVVIILIGGRREREREGLDRMGRGPKGGGWPNSAQGKELFKRCACFWKLTHTP